MTKILIVEDDAVLNQTLTFNLKMAGHQIMIFLFNFTYIGTAVAVGMSLFASGFKYARMMVQLAVGLYMLVFLGIISRENMQIEGFWYYMFLGVFQAAVIHYLVAKIAGPLFFGRGWCGYACWTAMVLDFLPYKTPQQPRREKLGWFRLVTFVLSFVYVLVLSRLYPSDLENLMFISFIVGNAIYYAVGIALAFAFKDNRVFCKYVCPITVFLKPASELPCIHAHQGGFQRLHFLWEV